MKKRILGVVIAATVAVAAGWNFNQSKKVELSELALANVEALASGESGSSITGECSSSVVIVTECRATCICGKTWYPSPRVYNASARNLQGRCTCGYSFG